MEPTFVVHIVVEVDVHTCGRVVDQEPTCLRQRIAVGLRIHEDRADAQRSLQQTFHSIITQFGFLADLLTRQTLIGIAQEVENTPFQHQA